MIAPPIMAESSVNAFSAGNVIPVVGVSAWLSRFLRSMQLEDSLAMLMELFAEANEVRSAVWCWAELPSNAIGIVADQGQPRLRMLPCGDDPPSRESLARASFPELPVPQVEVCVVGAGALCWAKGDRIAPSHDELAWFETLFDWLVTRERHLRDARLHSLAEFAAGAGHEINNPLGTILGRAQLLQRQAVDSEQKRALSAIGGQALRIRDLISDAMVFARPPAPKRRIEDCAALLRVVIKSFQPELTRFKIQIHVPHEQSQTDTVLSADVDAVQFQVVCVELLRNAIRAACLSNSCSLRRIGMRIRLRSWQLQDWLELDIYNNGPELTSQERRFAFDPFYSGRDAGRGLGFGLTKCWRIVTGHHGVIDLVSSPEGTTFRTLWPRRSI